jgi:hypothetical protein
MTEEEKKKKFVKLYSVFIVLEIKKNGYDKRIITLCHWFTKCSASTLDYHIRLKFILFLYQGQRLLLIIIPLDHDNRFVAISKAMIKQTVRKQATCHEYRW